MTTTIKITELTNIGANLASSTVIPVVNMAGTPTTEKTILGNVANFILAGAGGNYVSAAKATTATTANTVLTNAQPNITSMGNLTGLTVSNVTGIVNFTTTANVTLVNVGNLHIAGGTAGQLLSTNGNGTLSWASDTTTYGNSNVVTLLSAFGSNTITTTGNVSVGNIIGNGQALTNIAGANVSGFVANANVSNTAFSVAAANVSGLGNIATINLTGNSSNVLYGNGVFAAVAGGANTGNVTFSNQVVIGTGSNDGSGGLYLAPGNNSIANSAVQYLRVRGGDYPTHIHLDTGDNQYFDQYFGDDAKYLKLANTGNIVVRTDDLLGNGAQWTFDATGGTIFPTLIVQRGDNPSGTITGQTLLFGDNTQEAIISTPDGNSSYQSSQRLVINPGQGYDNGEGGDIYLWAGRGGDGSGSGGDIKIRGGQGGASTTGGSGGDGGYIRIEAGDSATTGGAPGYIDINGGINYLGAGGYVDIQGGQGHTIGGDANITGGYGYNVRGGNVNIWGGGSANGQINEGNVNIQTGGKTWTYDPSGNLTVPGNLVIAGNTNVFGTTAALIAPAGNLPLLSVSSGSNGGVSSLWVEDIGNVGTSNIAAVYANPTPGSKIVRIAVGQNGGNAGPNLWDFGTTGNLTLPTGGHIIVSGGLVSSGASPAPSINGFSITNSVGISGNGNIAGNNISATGNITANNFIGNGNTLSNVATKITSSWTLASGVNTVNISVPLNGTYAIWINGNIPNGIVTYTATAVITNTNVPVLGEQYAWYYAVGNALVLTSIPNQFTGTVGSISNVNTYAGNTANVFTFGITNNSGNTAVVNYGYTKL